MITFKEAAIESAVWIAIGARVHASSCWWLARRSQAAGEYLAGLPDREEPLGRQRLRLGGDLQLLRGAREVPVPRRCSGASSAPSCCGPSSSSPASPSSSSFDWILYVFGVFLLYTAWKIARHDEAEVDPENNLVAAAGAQGRPVDRRVRRPEAVHPEDRQAPGHAAVRGADHGRDHRRGVRRRLGPGHPRPWPRAVHRVHARTPSPSSACGRCTSCLAGMAGPVPLPQRRASA